MEKYFRVLRDILSDMDNLVIASDTENAEAIETLRLSVKALAKCVGDYINEMDD